MSGGDSIIAARTIEAIEQLVRTLELDSNFAVAHLILGLAYAQTRSLDAAMSSVQRAIDLSGGAPSTLAVAALAYVFALQGRRADALNVLQRLETLSDARYSLDYCLAMVLAGLDDRSAACQRLERAVEQRYDRLIYLNVDPTFDPLRGDPRFRDVVRRHRPSEAGRSRQERRTSSLRGAPRRTIENSWPLSTLFTDSLVRRVHPAALREGGAGRFWEGVSSIIRFV